MLSLTDPIKIARELMDKFSGELVSRCWTQKDTSEQFEAMCYTLFDPYFPKDRMYVSRETVQKEKNNYERFFIGHDISNDGDVWQDVSFNCPVNTCDIKHDKKDFVAGYALSSHYLKKRGVRYIWNIDIEANKDKVEVNFTSKTIANRK